LAFSTDYKLSNKAAYLLLNSDQVIDKFATLKIIKTQDREKVIDMEIQKE
jgi:hypothetical protein